MTVCLPLFSPWMSSDQRKHNVSNSLVNLRSFLFLLGVLCWLDKCLRNQDNNALKCTTYCPCIIYSDPKISQSSERGIVPDFPGEKMETKIMESIDANSFTNPLMQICVAVFEALAVSIPFFLPPPPCIDSWVRSIYAYYSAVSVDEETSNICYNTYQSAVPGMAASASPRHLLEVKNLWHPLSIDLENCGRGGHVKANVREKSSLGDSDAS